MRDPSAFLLFFAICASFAAGGNASAAAQGGAAAPARSGRTNTSASTEWLASCFRCPAPTVVAKTGIGTANATAEARFTAAELKSSCAETEPNDVAGCVRRQMAEVGQKTYRATANCTEGRITTIDEQQYTLAGIWDNSDIGGGRTKWKGGDGNIVGRDNASGGLGISQQWEVLCPAPVSAALLRRAALPASAQAPAPPRAALACTGKRFCEESASFAAIVRDFRFSTIESTRIVSATIKFLNKTNRPLVLGYLRSAGVAIDERGNRYILASTESVRGMGEIAGRQFDPKFTLQPGQTADTRFEFAWRWNGRDILGQKAWDIELAVREANEVAPGQFQFGAETALNFRGVSQAIPAVSEAAPVVPSPATAAPAVTEAPAAPAAGLAAPAAAPVPVGTQPASNACAGKRNCFDAGVFAAEIQNATLTREGTYQDRVVRLNLRIRNASQQPLSLAYVAKSSVLTDNLGNRFFWGTAGTYDTSATGIGKVEARKADPQFTLAPGEARTATFTLRRRVAKTDPDGTGYSYSVSLAQLEVINAQQVRTLREHSVTFPEFSLTGGMGAAGASTSQSIRDLTNAIRGLGTKKP